MRPIHLRFSGLQSYKEPQQIDFERLTEVGLFGIFGPTGSGKSTILDAITLALYGRVERAGAGIQGIMNMQSNQLSVSFAFTLGGRLFRAERSYRRNKNNQVSLSGARLIEETDEGSLVLAEQNVAEVVTELVGLKVQDFTRAVVLPQGKFAEFLTLTGSERRSMLERLFGLSAYGRELSERTRDRFAEKKAELEKVEVEKQALGDASLAALQAATEAFEAASKEVKFREEELQKAQQVFNEGLQLLNYQKELAQVEANQKRTLEKGPVMEQVADKLLNAEKAEPLRHLLTSFEAAEKELEQATIRAKQALDTAQKAHARFETLKEEAQVAEKELNMQTPLLSQRKGELEEGVKLTAELAALFEEKAELAQKLSQLETQKLSAGKMLAAAKEKCQAFEEKLAALKKQRLEITVSAEERELLGKINHRLQMMKQHESELTLAHKKHQTALAAFREAKANWEKVQTVLEEQKTFLQKLEEKSAVHQKKAPQIDLVAFREELFGQQNLVKSLLALGAEEAQLRSKIAQTKEEQAKVAREISEYKVQLTAKKEELAKLETAREEALKMELALSLAQELEEGEPCPVCGSLEHPKAPEKAEFQDHSSLEKTKAEVEELETKLIRTKIQLEGLIQKLTEQEEQLKAVAEEITAKRGELPQLWQGQSLKELEELLKEKEVAYENVKRASEIWRQEEELLVSDLSAKNQKLTASEKTEAALAARAQTLEQALSTAQTELQQAQARLYKSREEFAALAGSLSPRSFEARYKEVQDWDRQLEELEVRQQQLEEELKKHKAREEAEAFKLQENELARTKATVLEEELQKKQSQLAGRLEQITAGESAEELLANLLKTQSLLQKKAEKSKEQAALAQAEYLEVAAWQGRSEEALEGAQKRFASLDQDLAAALKKAGFSSKVELAAALCSEEERQELRERLDEYKQVLSKLSQEMERLKRLIGQRVLTEKQWQELEGRYRTARELSQKAQKKLGAADENLKQLKERHQRWQELVSVGRDLKQEVNRLETLQTVLRGNVFVDFLAEEQLAAIAADATARLSQLTGGHYSLEIDEECNFEIIDHFSGNLRRPVNTLSGGETFLASLALALALSSHIQLRGKFPLEFFFLDEGFGTLDPQLLETVMTALEQLQQEQMTIGVISHVSELRQRLARRLYIEPAEPLGRGSRVQLEVG